MQNESSDEERCIKAETPHTNKWLGKQKKEKLEEESARTVQRGVKNRWRSQTHTYGKIKSDTQERTTCIHMCGKGDTEAGAGIVGVLEPKRWQLDADHAVGTIQLRHPGKWKSRRHVSQDHRGPRRVRSIFSQTTS